MHKLIVTFTVPVETEEEYKVEKQNPEEVHKMVARLVANLLGVEHFNMYQVSAEVKEYDFGEDVEDSSSG